MLVSTEIEIHRQRKELFISSAYKLEIGFDALKDQAHAPRRHQLSPCFLLHRCWSMDCEMCDPVDARRLCVAYISHIVDMLLGFGQPHSRVN